jgi:hypothetical protein
MKKTMIGFIAFALISFSAFGSWTNSPGSGGTTGAWINPPSSGGTNIGITATDTQHWQSAWLRSTNVFSGAGTTGKVTSATAHTNFFLRGDGVWTNVSADTSGLSSTQAQHSAYIAQASNAAVVAQSTATNAINRLAPLETTNAAQDVVLGSLVTSNAVWLAHTNLMVASAPHGMGTIAASNSADYYSSANPSAFTNASVTNAHAALVGVQAHGLGTISGSNTADYVSAYGGSYYPSSALEILTATIAGLRLDTTTLKLYNASGDGNGSYVQSAAGSSSIGAETNSIVVTDTEIDITGKTDFNGNTITNANGSGITNLNASALNSGTIPLARNDSAVVTNNSGTAYVLNSSGMTNTFSVLTNGIAPSGMLYGRTLNFVGGITATNADGVTPQKWDVFLRPHVVTNDGTGYTFGSITGATFTATGSGFIGNGSGLTNLPSASQTFTNNVNAGGYSLTNLATLAFANTGVVSNFTTGVISLNTTGYTYQAFYTNGVARTNVWNLW